MNDFERLLVRNTAELLLIPRYMSLKQHTASEVMAEELMSMKTLDKEKLRIAIEYSHCLHGRTFNDRKIIQTVIKDLYYLKNLKGE